MSPLALSLKFLQTQPDSRLVALAREGHEPAYEALVRRYRKELLSYCRRLQPKSGGAEDALQQALLQAWRALRSGAEVREVRPWLYRIAHNATLNSVRAVAAVPHEIADVPGGHEVEHLVEQRLQARAALAGMASLPALQRQVFVSTTLDGASHEEVASTLGLSSGAVRGLIYRARATLRAAAAAITPSPAVNWAVRRAEARPGRASLIVEALTGGGGAGISAVIAKGGAVLTVAGAVAGVGGVVLTHGSPRHRHAAANLIVSADRGEPSPASDGAVRGAAAPALGIRERGAAESRGGRDEHPASRRTGGGRAQELSTAGADGAGSTDRSGGDASGSRDGGSRTGSDGGSSSTSSGSSDGGSSAGTTASSTSGSDGSSSGPSGSSGGSDGGSSGGSDGGSSGGSDGGSSSSTSTTSGSDGATSGGGSGTSDGDHVTTTQTTSDGGSGSSGGS